MCCMQCSTKVGEGAQAWTVTIIKLTEVNTSPEATHLPILKVSVGIMSKFAALYPPQQYANLDGSSKLHKSYESDEGTPLLIESISAKKREKSAASKVWKSGETLCLKHVTTE